MESPATNPPGKLAATPAKRGPLQPITIVLVTPTELTNLGTISQVTVRPARVRDVLVARKRAKTLGQDGDDLMVSVHVLSQLTDLTPDQLQELTCVDFGLLEAAAEVFFPSGPTSTK